MSDNINPFGGSARYYDTGSEPSPRSAHEGLSPDERRIYDILRATYKDLPERIDKACKQWNRPLRDSIRSATALNLASDYGRQSVPIRVVDGLPKAFSEIISDIREPLIWKLLSKRNVLEAAIKGTEIVDQEFESIAKLLEIKPTIQNDDFRGSLEFVKSIIEYLDKYNLIEKFKKINEDVLGAYFFRSPRIEIYWMPIGIVASLLNVSPIDLSIIVLTHELSHAYTHLGHDTDGDRWDTESFASANIGIVEGLAQFYTADVCKRIAHRNIQLPDTFERLMANQSGLYRDFKSWAEDSELASEIIRHSMITARSNNINSYDHFLDIIEDAKRRIKRNRRLDY